MRYAIVLAGGIGSRFWPLSRATDPKQFLRFKSRGSMLEVLLDRISAYIKPELTYIASSREFRGRMHQCISATGLKGYNLFLEPSRRNTFAPIAFLANEIFKKDKDATIAVIPCDHFVGNRAKFIRTLRRGFEVAQGGRIVMFGMRPEHPETGYGYIEIKERRGKIPAKGFFEVSRLVEKPDFARAKRFIRQGRYLWNGGVFIFKPEVLLQQIQAFYPGLRRALEKSGQRCSPVFLWRKFPPLSIDYAIIEKAGRLAVIPAEYGWIDLGSWTALERIFPKDKNGNIFVGDCVDVASSNSLIWSSDRLVGTLGLNNILVVDTPDALLVCPKDRVQDVKKLLAQLQLRNKKRQI